MRLISRSAAVLGLLASASGLQVTTFTSKHVETAVETTVETVDFSSPVTIFWESVNSDPQSFGIELVNMRVYPNIRQRVATGVRTSARSYTIDPVPDFLEGGGFQFNLVAEDSDNSGVLARSHQFISLRSHPMEGGSAPTTISEDTTASTPTSMMTSASPSSTSAPAPTASSRPLENEDGMPLVPPNQRVSGDYGNEDDTPVAPPNQRVSGDYGNDDESAGISLHRLDGSCRVCIGIAALTFFLGLIV